MKNIAYLIFSYGEHGPERGFICLSRDNLLREWESTKFAFCRAEDIDPATKALENIVANVSDETLLDEKIDFLQVWGGAAIKAFWVEG